MNDFDDLMGEIDRGRDGLNLGLSMGHERLNRYIGIRKRIYTLIFAPTGAGKSAYVHTSYILNPYDDMKLGNTKFKVFLFSMERSKKYTLMKWTSRKIFLDTGYLIPIAKMMGWWREKLNDREYDLIKQYEPYLTDLLKHVDIIEGPQNPTGIYKYLKNYAEDPANGKREQVTEFHSIYTPVNPGEIIIPIIDTIGLTKSEKGQNKKEAIDKVSEYMQYARDFWGYSPVVVSQVNRDMSNPIYQKMGSFEPTIDSAKESGRPGEDSDCIISIWDPRRYNTTDDSYDVSKFVDTSTGANYFRKVKILKNSYGEDGIGCGMGFHGAIGQFKELLKPSEMEGFDYDRLFSGKFFIK